MRLDVTLNPGDIAGIGWERQADASGTSGQSAKGTVFFTYNGRRLSGTIDDVMGNMWPVVHLQKKVIFLFCVKQSSVCVCICICLCVCVCVRVCVSVCLYIYLYVYMAIC